ITLVSPTAPDGAERVAPAEVRWAGDLRIPGDAAAGGGVASGARRAWGLVGAAAAGDARTADDCAAFATRQHHRGAHEAAPAAALRRAIAPVRQLFRAERLRERG